MLTIGRVEAQMLVERRRPLKHTRHVRDFGGVEAQLLVERRRTPKHTCHVRDARGVPIRYVVVEGILIK